MRKYITYVLLCSLVLTWPLQASQAKTPPPGTGSGSATSNILLLIDTSGSMNSVVAVGSSQSPVDLVFASNNKIYVAHEENVIQKHSASGAFEVQWGETDDGTHASNMFDFIFAIDADSSNYVYVSDKNNGRVMKYSEIGFHQVTMNLTSGPAQGVALDSNDYVYAINGDGAVEKFTSSGTAVGVWANSGGVHVDVDSNDNIIITDYAGQEIEIYDTDGNLQSSFSLSFNPYGIAVDKNDDLYITDYDNNKVYHYQQDGTYIAEYGGTGGGSGKFRSPSGADVNASGKVYIADNQNKRIQSTDGNMFLTPNLPETRLEQTERVLQEIMSDSDMTDIAHFGMIDWDSTASLEVEVSSTGASEIYTAVSSLSAGGTTDLDDAMELAKDYYLGPDSPRDPSASCQKNMIIVMSDGNWSDGVASSIAQELNDDYDIQTYAVGFLVDEDTNYTTLSTAGGTSDVSPIYASNWQQLYDVLTGYIQQASIANLTFTAPTIIPGVTSEEFLIQATFTYKRDYQWKGRLKKYALDSDGNIDSTIWDAGDVLNGVAAADRNLWTVHSSFATSLNNFTTTNRDYIKLGLEENAGVGLTDGEADALIEYVRGVDSYSEFPLGVDDENEALISGERWKLADIYHSRALVIGAPSMTVSDEANTNSDAYYNYTNGYTTFQSSTDCGGTCSEREEIVVVGSNAGILHAFASDDGEELWGFIPPSVLPNMYDIVTATSGTSNSIYGVDGSPTVKDIYYGGSWRTVLMGGLRQGGNSYFALDITDVNNPEHLFTFAHNTENNMVSYWAADGTRTDYTIGVDTIPAEDDYSALGEAWSQPIIIRIPISGVDRWVALIAGGYNSAVNPNYGANLFVLDLEDGGKVIEKIDLVDADATDTIENAVPPRVTAVTANTTSYFTGAGALVYVTDLEGKLWVVNLTDSGTLYDASQIFQAEATASNDRYAFHELASSITSGDRLIHFFGTGDLMDLEDADASIQNRIFGIYDVNFPSYTSVSPVTYTDLTDASAGSCPTESHNGWYMDMASTEKVSAAITVSTGVLFVPRFTPDPTDICSGGSSTLSELDYECGSTIADNELGSGIVTQAVMYKGKLYMGISSDAAAAEGELPDGYQKVENLIIGTPTNAVGGEVEVEAWWEVF